MTSYREYQLSRLATLFLEADSLQRDLRKSLAEGELIDLDAALQGFDGFRTFKRVKELQHTSCRDQDQAFKDMETDSIEQVLEGLSWLQNTQGDRL